MVNLQGYPQGGTIRHPAYDYMIAWLLDYLVALNINLPAPNFDHSLNNLRELRRHPDPIRYTLLSAFFWLRIMEISDNLFDLLIQIVHRISVRAERKVEREILNDLRRVSNKYGILFNLAQTAIDNPNGIIK